MTDHLLTENNVSLRAQVVADRLAGMRNTTIAKKYGISRAIVGYHLRKAVRYREVTAEAINRRPVIRPDRETYDRNWIARVRAKCQSNDKGCWHWPGTVTSKGYGQTPYDGVNVMIHRHMYKLVHKVELATETFVCHTCDNRRCCNPDHLWLGSTADNIRDMMDKGRNFFQNQTHCKRGHPFTPENTYVRNGQPKYGYGPSRVCLTCQKMRSSSEKYRSRARERQRLRRAATKSSQVTI